MQCTLNCCCQFAVIQQNSIGAHATFMRSKWRIRYQQHYQLVHNYCVNVYVVHCLKLCITMLLNLVLSLRHFLTLVWVFLWDSCPERRWWRLQLAVVTVSKASSTAHLRSILPHQRRRTEYCSCASRHRSSLKRKWWYLFYKIRNWATKFYGQPAISSSDDVTVICLPAKGTPTVWPAPINMPRRDTPPRMFSMPSISTSAGWCVMICAAENQWRLLF